MGAPQNPQLILIFFQDPAPVKTMTISSKRVSLVKWSGSRDGACGPLGSSPWHRDGATEAWNRKSRGPAQLAQDGGWL